MKAQKIIFIISVTMLLGTQSFAQRRMKQMDADKQEQEDNMRDNERKPWREKVSFGGNLGASFGSGFSSVLLQPMVFYKIKPKTMVGGGFTYIYWSQKYSYAGKTVTFIDNVYGVNLFARQVLFNPLFAHVEYNPLNFTQFDYQNQIERRVWRNAFYVGGGIQQTTGGRGGYYFMVLYDLLWNATNSFYPTPYNIRMGFYF